MGSAAERAGSRQRFQNTQPAVSTHIAVGVCRADVRCDVCCVYELQVAEMFKLDEHGKAVSVQVFYDLVC